MNLINHQHYRNHVVAGNSQGTVHLIFLSVFRKYFSLLKEVLS